jgi:hypothetical protein
LTFLWFPANHGFVPFVGAIRAAAILLYVAGLVGPCLSSCLAPAAAQTVHECCEPVAPGKEFRTPGKDCCAVRDQAPAPAAALQAAPSAVIPVLPLAVEGRPLGSVDAAIRTAAPPLLVLRI